MRIEHPRTYAHLVAHGEAQAGESGGVVIPVLTRHSAAGDDSLYQDPEDAAAYALGKYLEAVRCARHPEIVSEVRFEGITSQGFRYTLSACCADFLAALPIIQGGIDGRAGTGLLTRRERPQMESENVPDSNSPPPVSDIH